MVQNNYLDHTGSDGSTPQERADKAGYHVPPNTGWIVVEAISAISADPSGPVNWWLGDGQHRNVLLNARWREVGVGYAQGGQYGNYWTADFGCRPGVLPTVAFAGSTYQSREGCGDPAVGAALAATATPSATLAPTATATAALAVPTVTPAPTVARSDSLSQTSLQIDPATADAGTAINVRWDGITLPTPTDWIGLYRPGDPDTAPITWQYVGCSQVQLDARSLGSCNVLLARTLAPGNYEFRLFAANAYERLAGPSALRVS